MPRRMPPLERDFSHEADKAIRLAYAGERIRAESPATSVARKQLTIQRIEALYETAFLRIFLRWEDFLEQAFLRYLCGFQSSLGPVLLLNPPHRTIGDAETAVLARQPFVSWADPNAVIKRCGRHMKPGTFYETVISSDLARLIAFKAVRNRIAHSSSFARDQFDIATRSLALRAYPGSSPGRFLRDKAIVTPAPKSWLEVASEELASLAAQICSY
jgi:hypothetical protein